MRLTSRMDTAKLKCQQAEMQGYCTSWPEPAPTSLRAQNMEEVGASERLESIWSKKHWRGRTPNSLCNRARHFTPDVQKKVYFLESKK